MPKLLAHGGCGCATPDWLIEHKHGFDENVDWSLIKELAAGALPEVLHWIQKRRDITVYAFQAMLRDEITDTFDRIHQDKLMAAFQLNCDQSDEETAG